MNSQVPSDSQQDQGKGRCWKLLFLKKWNPQPTVQGTKYLFLIIGVLFIVFGIIITTFNVKVKEKEITHYEKNCAPTGTGTCTITFTLDEDFNDKAYLFYGLENFYQNHRRYIKSKSSSQLSGTDISISDANTFCSPIVRNSDLGPQFTMSIEPNVPLDPSKVATPCGLIARSVFTDTYKLFHATSAGVKGAQVAVSETGIAWPADIGNKFKLDESRKSEYWINVEDEHFIVWMRTSGLPNFRKLWGVITEKLVAGTYIVEVQNKYNVEDFKGHKNIVISTSGPFGGKNYFLSIAFIVVGSISVLIAVAFYIKQRMSDSRFGSASHQD